MINIFIYQLIQKIWEYSQLPAKAQNKNLRQFRGIGLILRSTLCNSRENAEVFFTLYTGITWEYS